MKIEELAKKVNEIELKFEGLRDTMQVFQENINNNITWFYTVIGIIVALIGVVAVALYFLVKSAVKAGVENGINDVSRTVQTEIKEIKDDLQVAKEEVEKQILQTKNEFEVFKSSLDQRVIELIHYNSNIRWASAFTYYENKDFIQVSGLKGNIDWDSPITSVKVRDYYKKTDIPFEFVHKLDNGFAFRISESISPVEWSIVWAEKTTFYYQ